MGATPYYLDPNDERSPYYKKPIPMYKPVGAPEGDQKMENPSQPLTVIPSIGQNYITAQTAAGPAPSVTAPKPLAPLAPQYNPITGFGSDYWASLGKSQTNLLNQQYFDPGGIQQKVQQNLQERGLLGQGPEQQILQSQVYLPYSRAATELGENLSRLQQENALQVAQFNAQQKNQYDTIYSNLLMRDSSNQLEADKANATLMEAHNNLAGQLASAQSVEDLNIIKANIESWNAALKQNEIDKNFYSQMVHERNNFLNIPGYAGGTSTMTPQLPTMMGEAQSPQFKVG